MSYIFPESHVIAFRDACAYALSVKGTIYPVPDFLLFWRDTTALINDWSHSVSDVEELTHFNAMMSDLGSY